MLIEWTTSPNEQDIEFLNARINAETADYGQATPFACFARDSDDTIIAGCNGVCLYGALYTDQLWVDPEYRHQGLAKRLMEEAHDLGHQLGCNIASVQTMDFQNARAFYEKLGYKVDYIREGYRHGASCLFLSKRL